MTKEQRQRRNAWQREYMARIRADKTKNTERLKKSREYWKRESSISRRKEYNQRPEVKAWRADYAKRYRKKNAKKLQKANDERHLLRHYGMSLKDYYKLLKEQNYSCALCEKAFEKGGRKPAVDHCHKTGKIRGIIHPCCNTLLGQAGDDISVLELAIKYLQKYHE